ncbi:LysR substrate-binding domain-containing protein [Jannaschia aquimarina]|uniref:GcvA_2 protein n=1 Tax=Jannaschia aquimarina TaxID=935700 RepID=A0A0D1EI38_9RHOB|nr:LysR substrate-binding domain-containing protein [Jannaschia aquimarina]KIT16561.1 Glycine cleavage system transcriptional activator [Jannaschia aquimarina]SNT41811.1 LysR family transcriptional regulator, glycine cleavage system transcriptional activator [Jannaschia aquimarina]
MRDLPLSHLRALAAVRAEGGVRAAARRLGVEHSAVSRSLRELERWLGAPLTRPGTRGGPLHLTAQGLALADAALRTMIDLSAATAAMREGSGTRSVSICTPPSIAARWLLPRLDRMQAECSGIEVSIVVDEMRMAPLDATVDLTLRMGPKPKTPLTVHELGDDAAYPVMGKAAWEHAGRPNNITALRDLPLLHNRDTNTAWDRWREVIGPADLDVRKGVRLTSSDLVLRAAEAGRGVTLERGWLEADAIRDGQLVRPFGDLSLPLPGEWWLAEGDNTSARHSVRQARDWLIAEGDRAA